MGSAIKKVPPFPGSLSTHTFPVSLDDLLDQGQAEPGAAEGPAVFGVDAEDPAVSSGAPSCLNPPGLARPIDGAGDE